MGALRLLGAGPSFLPMWQQTRRYRTARQGMLPNFGSRPVQRTAALAANPAEIRSGKCPPAPVRAADLNSRVAKPFTRGRAQPAVQPELALENVCVVRNDLSDSDWEWQAVEGRAGALARGFLHKAVNLWRRIAARLVGSRAHDAS